MPFRDDLENAVRGAACLFFQGADNIVGWQAGVNPVPGAGALAQNFTRPALNGAISYFCDVEPDPPPPVPFTGGQCVGTTYGVEVNVIRNGTPVTFTNTVLGPLGLVRYEQDGSTWRGRWYRPDGETILWSFDSISTGFPQPTVTSYGVTSVQAGPDNCGDLASDYPPPTTPPPINERTFPLPVGGLNLQLQIGLGNIQVNGDLTVPITITGPSIELSGEINLNNNKVNFNIGGGDPNTDNCSEKPPSSDPPPTEPEPPDDPDDPSKQIIGVLVTVTDFSNSAIATVIAQDDNPNILAPAVGYVNFRIKVGDAFAWTSDYPVKNTRHFIPVPAGFTAVSVAGTPRQGVVWTLTPIKGEVEPIIIT